jgi:hypothetical protein
MSHHGAETNLCVKLHVRWLHSNFYNVKLKVFSSKF